MPLAWRFFFSSQRSPVLRSQLLVALMAGTQMSYERVPTASLLDAVLLATATRRYLEAEIVDDYAALLRRTEEKWKEPEWTCRTFDSIHANFVSGLLYGWTMPMDELLEVAYVPGMAAWYLGQEPPQYFKKEITK